MGHLHYEPHLSLRIENTITSFTELMMCVFFHSLVDIDESGVGSLIILKFIVTIVRGLGGLPW